MMGKSGGDIYDDNTLTLGGLLPDESFPSWILTTQVLEFWPRGGSKH